MISPGITIQNKTDPFSTTKLLLVRRETFLSGLAWLSDYISAMELEGGSGAALPVVLVGNKKDLEVEVYSFEILEIKIKTLRVTEKSAERTGRSWQGR